MSSRPFKQVDVFTAVPFKGNPVAVVLDGSGLSTDAMQAFANWTNLSETTFVLPATVDGADYHLRIFTPKAELPFAGHPTLGSAHAVLDAGLVAPVGGKIVQQCGVGLVEIAVPDNWRAEGVSFTLPSATITAAPEQDVLRTAIGADLVKTADVVNVGPKWVIAHLAGAASLKSLAPDLATLAAYDRRNATTGLTVFADDPAEGVLVRSFAPVDGIAEDPVCGSGNGAVAAYRLKHGLNAVGDSYVGRQGREIGRNGFISVRFGADGIHIGGQCVTCVNGMVEI